MPSPDSRAIAARGDHACTGCPDIHVLRAQVEELLDLWVEGYGNLAGARFYPNQTQGARAPVPASLLLIRERTRTQEWNHSPTLRA